MATPVPSQPEWLLAVRALIPENIPHVIVYADRLEDKSGAEIAVASNANAPFALELLTLGQKYIAQAMAKD